MSQREDGDLFKNKVNGLSNHNSEEGHELELDDTLTALFASTLISPDDDNLNDISQIAGEYSSLNNTIDELNRYLDRWDERHEQLRAHIREAIRASEDEEEETEECLEEDENKESSNGSTYAVNETPSNNDSESKSEEEQFQNENGESI